MAGETLSTLDQIRIKVRRLTKSPSAAQIADATLDDYINTFVLYDFPETIRLFTLATTLTFYTEPYIDTYETNTADVTHPLYNFKNVYTTVQSPIYIAGKLIEFSLSPIIFNAINESSETVALIGTGDGATVLYSGTLNNFPVKRNKVLFSSINTANSGLAVYDDGEGGLSGDVVAGGTINYVTGAYNFSFTSAPASNADINSNTLPFTPGIPTSVLYNDNKFIFSPVPDLPYRVEVSVYKRPSEMLNADNPEPELAQWWQFIALGAAKKFFQDRMDVESIALIQPELKQQELLVLRRTIMQQSQSRVATIYDCTYGVGRHRDDTSR